MRKVININNGWKFIKEDEVKAMELNCNVEKWEEVNLPHTWNAIDGANGFDFYKGACWYRKEVIIDNLLK